MEIMFRPATLDDAAMLFEWRNDYLTRRNARNSDMIEWNDHLKWLTDTLEQPNRKLLIAEFRGNPVGMIRFDYFNDSAELTWSVATESRGKGYGVAMLRAAIANEPSKDIFATIKMTNGISIKTAIAAGFYFDKMQDNLGIWKIDKRGGH